MKNPSPPPPSCFTLHEKPFMFLNSSPIVTHYWRQHDITTASGIASPQSFFYTMIGEGQGLMIHSAVDEIKLVSTAIPLFFLGPSQAFVLLGPVVCCLSWIPETRMNAVAGFPAPPIIESCLFLCIRNWNPFYGLQCTSGKKRTIHDVTMMTEH